MSSNIRSSNSLEAQHEAGELKMPIDMESKENVPAGYVERTPEEKARNRALNLKMDIFLLPMLAFLYLFNGLDRGNVGNAQTQGTFFNSFYRLIANTNMTFEDSQRTLVQVQVISILLRRCSSLRLFSSNLLQLQWEDGLAQNTGFPSLW